MRVGVVGCELLEFGCQLTRAGEGERERENKRPVGHCTSTAKGFPLTMVIPATKHIMKNVTSCA